MWDPVGHSQNASIKIDHEIIPHFLKQRKHSKSADHSEMHDFNVFVMRIVGSYKRILFPSVSMKF